MTNPKPPTTEADAYLLLESLRWANGNPVECPHCGHPGRCYFLAPEDGSGRATRTGAMSERRVWKCGACRRQFSVLTGTSLQGVRVPMVTVVQLVYDLCAHRAPSARAAAAKYGISPGSANKLLKRVQLAVPQLRPPPDPPHPPHIQDTSPL